MNDSDYDLEVAMIVSLVTQFYAIASTRYVLDGRSFRASNAGSQTMHHEFWPKMKQKRDKDRFRQTVRCEPDAFDTIGKIITPE